MIFNCCQASLTSRDQSLNAATSTLRPFNRFLINADKPGEFKVYLLNIPKELNPMRPFICIERNNHEHREIALIKFCPEVDFQVQVLLPESPPPFYYPSFSQLFIFHFFAQYLRPWTFFLVEAHDGWNAR
jgi:hypothetical protein